MRTDSWSPAGRSAIRVADRVGEGELAAQAVSLAGADAEVGADDGHPVGVGQSGAGLPAVAELLLLVAQGERLARVLLRLDAADLVLAGLVVEQQDDQARDRGEALEVRGAGEFVAGAGGQQPALAGVQHDPRLVAVGPVADARHELAGAREHRGERADRVGRDVAPLVGGQFDVLERDALERAAGALAPRGGDVEERRVGQQGVVWSRWAPSC